MMDIPKTYPELKTKFLEMYGWTCACCGEPNPKFLTLDHVNGDGGEKRAQILWDVRPWSKKPLPRIAYRPTTFFLRDAVINYQPEEYQILCYNCNCARAHNEGICPHELEDKSYIPYLKDMLEHRYRGARARRRLGQIRVCERREKRERANRSIDQYIRLVHFH